MVGLVAAINEDVRMFFYPLLHLASPFPPPQLEFGFFLEWEGYSGYCGI